MKLRFFAIPAAMPEGAQEDMDRFCATHRVIHLEKHLVDAGERSYWAVCISYLEPAQPQPGSGSLLTRRGKTDYRDVLDEQEFALFAQLRSLRKTLADQDSIPAYALFTNEQLAAMVRQRVTSKAAMGNIDGIGTARIEKYGEAFLQILRAQEARQPETMTAAPKKALAPKTSAATQDSVP
ncbi:MAG: HRDC domain-containing protein [Candidatus Tectimicrobiota bacterium]